jgi:hypothetical protein
VVRLDRAGAVTGVVRTASGTTAPYAYVSLGDWSTHNGGGLGLTQVDEQGRYTLSYLGPYQWLLMFHTTPPVERQYSGGVANRHLADRVTIQSGQTTSYDFQFRQPVAVTAEVTGVTGGCELNAVNAVTGDVVGETFGWDCAAEDLHLNLVGPQVVKLSLTFQIGEEEFVTRWYGGDSFMTAKPVLIASSGSKTITMAF